MGHMNLLFDLVLAAMGLGLLVLLGRLGRRRLAGLRLRRRAVQEAERAGLLIVRGQDLGDEQPLDELFLSLDREPLAGAVRAWLAGSQPRVLVARARDLARLLSEPPSGWRPLRGRASLLGLCQEPDHEAIRAERKRLQEKEIPRIQQERQAAIDRAQVECHVCGGTGQARASTGAAPGRCRACNGIGQVLDTQIFDHLPAVPVLPKLYCEIHVVFLVPEQYKS